MRVGIIGAGAMGTFFAYTLAQRQEVTLLDVRADVIEVIAAKGVAVDDAPARKVTATRDPAAACAVNVLFVFVKAQDTLRALRPFAGRLDPSTPIVSLQNGLGNEEAVKAALGGGVPLVLGVTSEGAATVAPGRSRRTAVGATVLGSGGASQTAVHSVESLLEAGNLSASVVYDIRPHLWGKLIANAAVNPVAALLDQTNGVISRDRDAAELARSLAHEGAETAKALRVNLPFADAWEYVREVVAGTADAYNSMTLDLNAQRQTEIEQINGAIAAAGKRTGTPTPYNEVMLRLVRAKERAAEEAAF
jgi:2-dehydropantoate 2-reductase